MIRTPLILYRAGLSYAGFMTLWFMLRLAFFDTIWWLALLNTMALYLFLPLPILLGLTLVRHCWRILPALALPVAGFAWLFGALFLPPWPLAPAPVTTSLSVMTFNLLYRNRDTAVISAAIASAHPDLIGVQELSTRQMTTLRELLRHDYPYAQFHKPEREAGVGLFSRFPITAATSFPLPPRNLALHATVLVSDTPVHVLVVHLSPHLARRSPLLALESATTSHYLIKATEIAAIEQELLSIHAPTLLLCDCNLTDTSQAYAGLAMRLQDSFREVGWGLGHTTYLAGPLPLLRYDYIWHSVEFVAVDVEIGPAGGSDHLPVIARLGLRATAVERFDAWLPHLLASDNT